MRARLSQLIRRVCLTMTVAALCLLLLAVGPATAASPAGAAPNMSEPIAFNVLESNSTHTVVEVLFPDLSTRRVDVHGRDFDLLSMPGASRLGEIGAPGLLVAGTMIAVPPASGVELRILEEDYATLDGITPLPVQEEEWTTDQPLFIEDAAYTDTGYHPGHSAEVGDPAIMRDFRVVALRVFPALYDAAAGELRVARRLLLELDYSSPGTINIKTRANAPSRAFRSIYESAIANYDFVRPRYEDDSSGKYLIITHDNYYSSILPLAEWKHLRGMEVEIARLSVIGSSASAIKTYIQTAYDTWTVPPDYVLLVGDTEYLPVGTGSTDDYYAKLAGSDFLVDVFVGRISADSVTDCNLIVAKTLGYERTPYMSDTDWFNSGTLIVRNDYDEDDAIYFADTWYAYDLWENEGFAQIDTFFSRNGSNYNDVHAAVTDGRVLVNYRGQGVSNWWSPFDVNPANTSPGFKLPLVISATCGTGSFYSDGYPCETWMRAGTVANPKGSVAFMATSKITSSHADYRSAVDQGIFNAMFNLKMHTTGEALVHGKLNFYNIYGLQSEYEGWNLQGDPDLDVWTAVPRYPDVTHPLTVPTSPGDLPVHVEYGGNDLQEMLVCAYAPGEVYAYGYTNAQGDVTLSISPADADTVWITVTGHNLHPYEGHAVVTATGPYLIYADSIIDDSSTGNDDGVITPGETIELTVELENSGPEDAIAVTGVLTSADTYVSLGDSTSSYGTIASGNTGTNAVPFTFAPTTDCPNGHELQLTLETQDSSRTRWVINVPDVTVAAADLSHVSTVVGDASPGGDGDGVLEPGETAWLTLTLENGGPIDLEDVVGILSTGSQYAAVTDPDGAFGDMAGGGGTAQSVDDAFRVSVSPSAAPGYELSLSLTAEGEAETYQHSQEITLSVILGGDTATGPTGPDAYGYYAYDVGDGWTGQAPVYDWVELVGTGSLISAITDQDAATTTLTLPFTFHYYGADYTSISVCSNGFVALGTEDYRFGDNSAIPSTHGPDAMVAPFWDDLDPSDGGDVYQWYDSANHRWICQFDAVEHYGGGNPETFEVILLDPAYYPTATGDGEIIFQYQTVAFIYSATVGIENLTQTVGIQYLFDSTYDPSAAAITSGQAIKLTTEGPSAPPVWLVAAGSTVDDSVGGDGDGHAEPQERVDLIVTLDNLGTDPAGGITGTLTTSDPDVSIDVGTASFGTIGAGLSGDNAASPFRITVGASPTDELVELDLHLSTGARYDTYDVLTLVLDLSQTGVDGETPLVFVLRQNSPNPFRDGTTLAFDLPSPSHAQLTVYNVAGRKVATVVDGDYPAGRHSVSWNGRDDNGRQVSAGIYFYMLEADQGRSARKLILIR